MSAQLLDPSESQHQRAVIQWWAYAHTGLGVRDERLLFAVPNGGARNVITASILKGEGVRPGVSDLLLLVARGGCHGMAIEMKTKGGRVRPEQATFTQELVRQGYHAVTCWSADDAMKAIERYLSGLSLR